MPSSSWRYIGCAAPERLTALKKPLPAANFPEALWAELRLVCFHIDPAHDDSSFKRAVFCGTVSPTLFDWFFNSLTGYRGAFFESREAGNEFNRKLIAHLAPTLTNWAVNQIGERDRLWLSNSLAAPSAKAWLSEHPGFCEACKGEWTPALKAGLEIENERWEHSAHVHATWGRQAPLLSKIRIFGGFVDDHQQEWLAPHKADRAGHIWEHGWS